MFSRNMFILGHQLGDRNFHYTYKNLLKSQWKPYSDQKFYQEKQLKIMIDFVYKNVPFYHKLFRELNLTVSDIKRIEDLEKLPIITKDTIRDNWVDFTPVNLSSMKYNSQATGGSTGTPLQYRLLKADRFLNATLLYRGWGHGGYKLADRMIFLAGSSINNRAKSNLVTKGHEITRNIKKLSSFDMSEYEMNKYVNVFNTFQPKFIRGYASSIYFYAKWLHDNNITLHLPNAVFTTSEKLLPNMREMIGNTFNCDVFDGYGLNDGGVSAFECPEHNGLHIDTERSIMEVVDDNGCQVEEGVGRILATSLHNYAMPFIRYDTGDIGHIITDTCGCGRGSKLLKEVIGRQHEMLQTPEGKFVHGAFFNSYMFAKIKGIIEFQVVQQSLEKLIVNIVVEEHFDEKELDTIRAIIKNKSEGWVVEIRFVDRIERTKSGKYKFIISEI